MNPVRTFEMQCTRKEFMRELPFACGARDYEMIGERIIVHENGREVHIEAHDEPIRHLGSLDLPMEKVTLRFNDYSEEEADKFLQDFMRPILRCGG